MGRILAIDYGRARIGLAVSDPLGLTARPLPALRIRDPGEAVREVLRVASEEEVDRLLIGVPLRLDGTPGPAAGEVRRFAEALRAAGQLPLLEEDERLTSKQAHAELKAAGVRHRARREQVDSTAALLLLRSHLARHRR